MNVTLKIWRQSAPKAQGKFELYQLKNVLNIYLINN